MHVEGGGGHWYGHVRAWRRVAAVTARRWHRAAGSDWGFEHGLAAGGSATAVCGGRGGPTCPARPRRAAARAPPRRRRRGTLNLSAAPAACVDGGRLGGPHRALAPRPLPRVPACGRSTSLPARSLAAVGPDACETPGRRMPRRRARGRAGGRAAVRSWGASVGRVGGPAREREWRRGSGSGYRPLRAS
jgi:hypothetical protein